MVNIIDGKRNKYECLPGKRRATLQTSVSSTFQPRKGHALLYDRQRVKHPGLGLHPPAIFNDWDRAYSRESRTQAADYNNMLLNQPVIHNKLDAAKWAGNGFQGHIQYVPYFGICDLRPGEKLQRDIQMSTMPREMSRELNRSQMARANIIMGDMEKTKGHVECTEMMQELNSRASARQYAEDPYKYDMDQPG